jgi:hypothetical protein
LLFVSGTAYGLLWAIATGGEDLGYILPTSKLASALNFINTHLGLLLINGLLAIGFLAFAFCAMQSLRQGSSERWSRTTPVSGILFDRNIRSRASNRKACPSHSLAPRVENLELQTPDESRNRKLIATLLWRLPDGRQLTTEARSAHFYPRGRLGTRARGGVVRARGGGLP